MEQTILVRTRKLNQKLASGVWLVYIESSLKLVRRRIWQTKRSLQTTPLNYHDHVSWNIYKIYAPRNTIHSQLAGTSLGHMCNN